MNRMLSTWQEIREEVRRRVHARVWKPGDAIPNEADLAAEFGCARATVNRALRDLAEAGLLERRRKAGTRVALHPVGRATLRIPVIRAEVEARGQNYGYRLLARSVEEPPRDIRSRMALSESHALHVISVHLAGGVPLVAEDRWIGLAVVPGARDEPFKRISANEWLLANAPFTHGDIGFFAAPAQGRVVQDLAVTAGAALFVIQRTTWDGGQAVTTVRQHFAPGYRLETSI